MSEVGWSTVADRQAERELWGRLLAGDPVASSDLFGLTYGRLVGSLQRRFPTTDGDLVDQVVADAVARLAQEPARYEPGRGGLLSYLWMDARGDLLNELQKQRRRAERETLVGDVELSLVARNSEGRAEQDPAELVANAEAESSWSAELYAGLSPSEQQVAELIGEGERRTAVFARVLGLEGLSLDQQRRAVKRVKDRLKKRLRRRKGGR